MHRFPVLLMLNILCFCLLTRGTANAQEDFERKRGGPHTPTELELRRLPPVCAVRIKWGDNPIENEDVRKWKAVLGDAFIHVHHYCFALNFLNRVQRGVGDKETLLGLTLSDLNYMRRIPADNILRPEVELKIGEVQYRLEKIPDAIGTFNQAIRFKPDYEQAYLLLSMCYRRIGDRASAIDTLQKGLARTPNSAAIRSALQEVNSEKEQPKAKRP